VPYIDCIFCMWEKWYWSRCSKSFTLSYDLNENKSNLDVNGLWLLWKLLPAMNKKIVIVNFISKITLFLPAKRKTTDKRQNGRNKIGIE